MSPARLLFSSSPAPLLFKIVLLKISSLACCSSCLCARLLQPSFALASCGNRSRLSSLHSRYRARRHQISLLIPNLARQSFKWPTELGSPPSTTAHLQRHH
ncbi:hypothetical protein ACSQ67_010399 [Phaseolus vulgaris]